MRGILEWRSVRQGSDQKGVETAIWMTTPLLPFVLLDIKTVVERSPCAAS